MKKQALALWILAWIILLVADAAPGLFRPSLELYWTPNPTNENVQAYRIYTKTNLSDPEWAFYVDHSYEVTNHLILPTDAGRFYCITASNIWGESPFSVAVWTPPRPSTNGSFQLR